MDASNEYTVGGAKEATTISETQEEQKRNSEDAYMAQVDRLQDSLASFQILEPFKADDQLAEPWRQLDKWNNWDLEFLEKVTGEIEMFAPPRELTVKQSRILILGPVGAGKSSFFNTISSVFRGHVTSQACSGNAEQSITSKYRMYQVRGQSSGQPLNFRLCDTRGLEETGGIAPLDLDYLLEGCVPDGYHFNPSSPISPDIPGFKRMPALTDKIHCVCFVLDGTSADVLSPKMLEKIKSLQIKIHQKDLSSVFRSQKIKDLVRSVSDVLGVPRNHVLPMKNYEKETDLNDDVNILAMLSLRQLLRASEDFMFNYLDQLDESTKNSDMVHVDSI